MNDTRMLDLVRAARGYLYTEELISDEEYAHLAALPSTESHERMRGYDDLRAQLAAVTRERDAKEREIQRLLNVVCDSPAGTATIVRRDDGSRICAAGHPARWVNIDLLRTVERERDEALAVIRELRQKLAEAGVEGSPTIARLERLACEARAIAGGCCLACENAEAALASTPSAEPTRTDAERWLGDGPEVPGGTLAFHASRQACVTAIRDCVCSARGCSGCSQCDGCDCGGEGG